MNTSHDIHNLLQTIFLTSLLGHNTLLTNLFSINIETTTSKKMRIIPWRQEA